MPMKEMQKTKSPPDYRRRFLLLGLGFVLVFLGSFLLGRYAVSLETTLRILGARLLEKVSFGAFSPEVTWTGLEESVVMNIRLPRILCAALVGAALSTAGASYQGMFRNPMVSPDLMGASTGAGFGASLAILLGLPYFGIMVKTMTEQYAAYYNSVPGVYVYSVDAGSCAAAAGIRQGDVITKLGDEEIKTNADLSTAKKAYKAGDTAEVTVFRGGEYLTLKVTFDEKKPDRPASNGTQEENPPAEASPEPAPEGEGGGQSIWDFFFGQIIPRGSEEPQESAAPDSEDGPGHFGS